MGSCSEDPHFCRAAWLLRFLSLLLGIWSTGNKSPGALGSGAWDSGAHSFLKQIRGGSVLFLVNKEAELEEISWGFGPESDYRVMMRVRRGAHPPTWVSLQDKYNQRVHVPNMTSLRIEKLTLEDSGQYRARGSTNGGREFNHVFHLTVKEPVPQPQILTKPTSISTSWCNVTLECTATGATEDLNVTWESKDLPGGLELRGTWGPVTSTSTLAVSLPLSQPTASITCVVSNSMDQKNVTLDLGRVCAPVRKTESHGLATASLLGSILGIFGAVLLTLGAGLYLWKTRGKKKKKMKPKRGADLQQGYGDDGDGVHYAELSQQESLEGKDKRVGEQHLEEEAVTTVYSEVRNPGQAMKII